MPIWRLCANLHPMKRDPLPVRERTRRAIRDELTQLAKDLFVEKGYDETTIDDLAAAAGMSKRTFFRYFASKEELVMGKYEILGEQLAEDLANRPADEPLWTSLRQVFGRIVEYFESEARTATAVAMENIVRDHPTLNASYLERVSRMQELVLDEARTRTGRQDPADPRTAAIVGAAFSCLIAAWTTWLTTNQARPFGDLLDQAMDAIQPTQTIAVAVSTAPHRP